jgi:hypothetical protein
MNIFHCDRCGQLVYFENVSCTRCGATLGFLPDLSTVSALRSAEEGLWQALAPAAEGRRYRLCRNSAQEEVCNWLVPAEDPDPYCRACRLNHTIPDLGRPGNRLLWARLEAGKRRMIYSVLRLGLPLADKGQDPRRGLAFDFLAAPDPSFRESQTVVTGHAEGLITIDVAEADDAVRERLRQDMGEPYRTILGHFRHEIGHYYWARLIDDARRHEAFRTVFGDERADYDQALQVHYGRGPRPDWTAEFVSAYASAHPWEDWAESWAHYLHIVDTLETSYAFGLRVAPRTGADPLVRSEPRFDPYQAADFDAVMAAWLPLTYAMNSLNRSMGQPDPYPFVLSDTAIAKLNFVHRTVRSAGLAGPRAT